ncbi:hypothetical protein MCOR32_006198 [Pyricularia oryzae]|nr:hypothetical protein MCOR32_006198 [Pyricularia oryzae]KAI6496116.1 hypothetical protein MCOR13_007080 [Pyricularia oryzae]KAI6529203.1 hypothetical protein MCOR16_005087 [Pyricularia oryzae]KAI6589925.1 hypothetical protein MCOR12_008616 [Pyricularia oryzae]
MHFSRALLWTTYLFHSKVPGTASMVFPGQKPTSISPTPTIFALEPRTDSKPTPFVDADGRVKNNIVISNSDGQLVEQTVCGYTAGHSGSPRYAPAGFDCRVDRQNSLFGICETEIAAATQCGFVIACVDSFRCTSGCGNLDPKFQNSGSAYKTATCSRDTNVPYCWDVVLDVAPQSQYTWHACGPFSSSTHTYLLTPTPLSLPSYWISAQSDSSTASSSTLATSNPASGSKSANGSSDSTGVSSGQDAPGTGSGQSDANNAPPIGVIVGASLAGLLVLCCTVLVALWILKRRDSSNTSTDMSVSNWQQQQQMSPASNTWPYMEAKFDSSARAVEVGPGQHMASTNELPVLRNYVEMEAPGQNIYRAHNTI